MIRGALSYNENKVKDGDAILLSAVNYPKDAVNLTFNEKLNVLLRNADLRPTVDHKCVHISINFDPSDNLSSEEFMEIARLYMEGVGFGNQPYLVYSHTDAAHPHLHILSTPIKSDGKLIQLHNLGKTKSSTVREKLEVDFNLVRARGRNSVSQAILRPADLTKAQYGRRQTKAEISNVVRSVFENFKFTTFAEYNAALNAFNVVADMGEPGTRMHEQGGLLYFMLDPVGNKIGKPIKASAIYDRPILKNISEKFEVNARKRDNYKARVCRIIDDVLTKGVSQSELLNELDGYDISVVFRKNNEGRTYGITYVDRKTLYIFNGSDLGKKYAAAGIMERLHNKSRSEKYGENERLVTDTISRTRFEEGIRSVMVQWMSQGLLVDANYGANNDISYSLGQWHTPKRDYSTLSPKLSRYLQINEVTPERTNYLHVALADFLGSIAEQIKELSDQQLQSHLRKMVDECFEVTVGGRSISSALLKEAKKKRKRRRR
jgi:Relaxase/Mobilisation nuclease domain.